MNPFSTVLNTFTISPALGGGYHWQGTSGAMCLLMQVMRDSYSTGFVPGDDTAKSAAKYVLEQLRPYERNELIDALRQHLQRMLQG
jgi:hypothetical protein